MRGPDVEPHPAVRHVDAVELAAPRLGGEAIGDHEVARQLQARLGATRRAGGPAEARAGGDLGEHVPGVRDVLSVAQRLADRVALGGEEREAHRAADQDRVGDLQEAVDDGDLVGDLGAADHGDQRARGVLEDAAQRLHLALRAGARRRSAAGARRPRCWRARGGPRRRRR